MVTLATVAYGGIHVGGLTNPVAQTTQFSGLSTQEAHLERSQDGHSA
jgi:hypothetical protein